MADAVYTRMCVSDHRTSFAKVFLELEAFRSLDPCNLRQIHEKDDYSSKEIITYKNKNQVCSQQSKQYDLEQIYCM